MIIAWPVVQAFLKANWKPIAVVLLVVTTFGWHKLEVNRAWHAGRDALKTEQAEEARRRNADAQAADAAARKCATDPACRLQDDGHRRD